MSDHHQPVLLQEAIRWLNVQAGKWYLDATFGRGGHTRAILDLGGSVIACDYDQVAIDFGEDAFHTELKEGRLRLLQTNFSQVFSALPETIKPLAGVLFDFGTSVEQLTDASRGFSFSEDGPLDMRLDQNLGVTAADLLNALPEAQLADLFKTYGGEEQARALAKRVVKVRQTQPLHTTQDLVKLVASIKKNHRSHLHPATKVFQALRIVVNSELQNIEAALPQALEALEDTGRLVTIAFHEGEDRLTKQFMNQAEHEGMGIKLTKKPITPSPEELKKNPRARSAKLRVFEKKPKN